MRRALALLLLPGLLAGCGMMQRLGEVGGPPKMTPSSDPTKDPAYRPMTLPMPSQTPLPPTADALWRPGSHAFFRDQRASQVGDIITVVVNVTDAANVTDNTTATRNSSKTMGTPNLFGLETLMPAAMTASSLMSTDSTNVTGGTGQTQRGETVSLRLAGVVTQVMPNGNLVVEARQEMRVNSELRELKVSGVVRPQDIASDNTVQHDRMAEARIAYGGRGQLTDVQTAPWGQQALDILLPF
jgi:flagellar L-ring protein precursor FlgH